MTRAYVKSTTGVESYSAAWLDSMTRLVQQLRGTGAKVLVHGPIPKLTELPWDCLAVHLDHATACSPLRSVAVNAPGIAAESVAVKADDGQYADLTGLFCTAERCPVIVGNTPVHIERGHLTLEYSRLMAPDSVRWPTAPWSPVDAATRQRGGRYTGAQARWVADVNAFVVPGPDSQITRRQSRTARRSARHRLESAEHLRRTALLAVPAAKINVLVVGRELRCGV